MEYSPKLKKLVHEFQQRLKDEGVAGVFVLADGHGFSEWGLYTQIPGSVLKVDPMQGVLRLRSKLKEDYAGDREAQRADMQITVNMLFHLAESSMHILTPIHYFKDEIDKEFKIEFGEDNDTNEVQQNN